jgi:DNA-binding IscR family transcriptional regulator
MMLSVSRRTDLGLKALRILAREPRVWTAAALAAAVPTTPAILNPALAAFVHAGWLVSGSGPSGGYLYRTAATPPSLLEVIESIEGPTVPDACVLQEGKRCGLISGEPVCQLHEGWQRARQVLIQELQVTPAFDTTFSGAARPGI